MTLREIADKFRRDLRKGDRKAAARIARMFLFAQRQIEDEIARVASDIEGKSEAFKKQRLEVLRVQASGYLEAFAVAAGSVITDAQRDAILRSLNYVEQTFDYAREVNTALVNFAFERLPAESLTELVGMLADGSPLTDWLKAKAVDTWQDVAQDLFRALALGYGPRKTARIIRPKLNALKTSALATSRQAQMNASRRATQMSYLENDDVVEGWYWLSARDMRTCPSCWAKHGTFHKLRTFLDSHIACRCTMIPAIEGVPLDMETGEEAFGELDDATKSYVLGPGRFALYDEGVIRLEDMPVETFDKRWGKGLRTRTLKECEALAERRREQSA